jgi:type I restriction enzyme S subunit
MTMSSRDALPLGWVWTTLGEIARTNYQDSSLRNLSDDFVVTFLPVSAVDALDGKIAQPEERRLADVRKDFTSFSEDDELFAKITPSMENGKATIASTLINGRGFGSTEFHVLSPGQGVIAEWLFHFVRQESFRADAKASFKGTAGQLRVPASFVESTPIALAPSPNNTASSPRSRPSSPAWTPAWPR